MAKTSKAKLALVPATTDLAKKLVMDISNITAAAPTDSKKFEKLNLPPLIKCQDIPVGTTISGKLVRIVKNFTGKDSMRESATLQLENGGYEFLFPFTGQIKQTFKGMLTPAGELPDKAVGKTLFLTRQPDGITNKYGGEKIVFTFDIRLER